MYGKRKTKNMKSIIKSLLKKILNRNTKKNIVSIDEYWIQKLNVKRVHDREVVFMPFLENKDVLHIGCTDYPIFDAKNNLHLKISNYTKTLHGMDVDKEGLDVLNNYYEGVYFTDIKQCYNINYDTVLVPETIEHVENIGIFLKEISKVNATTFIITGPNAFHNHYNNQLQEAINQFTEAVHPDHNCWFSPYTLKNAIEKYSGLLVNEIYLSNHDLMVVCICSKK